MSCFLLFTGVGSLIDLHSGKVLPYNTRTKRCAICKAASKYGYPSRKHDCQLNWTGSSESMEPDEAAELAGYASEHGAPVAVLVGDDDSCTIKMVRESVSHDVIKWSDTVHAKRSFATSLYVDFLKARFR